MSHNNNAVVPAAKRAAGFTLIELLTVLVIVGIGMALALPSFNDAIERNRIAAQTNELIASLSYARGEAIRRNDDVVLCAANAALDGCAADWSSDAWLVWFDADGDGALTDATEILRTGTISASDQLTSASTTITFSARGLADAATSLELQPTSCTTGKPYLRTINVSLTGLASFTPQHCGEADEED